MLAVAIIALVFIPSAGALILPPSDYFIVYLWYLYLFTLGVGNSSGCLKWFSRWPHPVYTFVNWGNMELVHTENWGNKKKKESLPIHTHRRVCSIEMWLFCFHLCICFACLYSSQGCYNAVIKMVTFSRNLWRYERLIDTISWKEQSFHCCR